MNALDKIGNICDAMAMDGFCHTPRVVDQAGFNLDGFEKQECEIDGIETEWVKQIGPGEGGDDYHGYIAYPIGDKFFVIEFNS